MQHRSACSPHPRTVRKAARHHAARPHIAVAELLAFAPPAASPEEDADYVNASPLGRLVVRLLMRFF